MKRLLCLLLAAAMIVGMLPASYAEEEMLSDSEELFLEEDSFSLSEEDLFYEEAFFEEDEYIYSETAEEETAAEETVSIDVTEAAEETEAVTEAAAELEEETEAAEETEAETEVTAELEEETEAAAELEEETEASTEAVSVVEETEAPTESADLEEETEAAEEDVFEEEEILETEAVEEEILSFIPYTDTEPCGDSLFWELSESGVLTISGTGAMYDFAEGGAPWYADRSSITGVVVDSGVTSVGSYAFYDCNKLTSVWLGDTVETIGTQAFCYCSGLGSIVLPDSVSIVGKECFMNCRNLTSITFGSGLTEVGIDAVYGCSMLTTVLYTGTLDSWKTVNVGSGNNKKLTQLYTGWQDFGSLSNGMLWYIDSAWILHIEGTGAMPDLSASAYPWYSQRTSLRGIALSDGVTAIGTNAFYGATGLKEIVLPAQVMSVGASAFYGCTGITELVIPQTVETIGSSAFYGCNKLASLNLGSVTTIGSSAFSGCSALTEVVIPDTVQTIEASAFYSCSKLAQVTIGSGVSSIGNNAFESCSALKKLYYNGSEAQWNRVTIGTGADRLRKLFVLTDNGWTDYGTCGTTMTWVLDENGTLTISGSGVMENYTYNSNYSRPNSPWTSYRSTITKVVVAPGVTSIGDYAFSDLSALTEVSISNTVTTIGEDAFARSAMTEIVIPDGVTTIKTYAFSGCANLTEITIGTGMTTLGINAFYNCRALTTINYAGTYEQWNALTLNTGNSNIVLLKNGWLDYGTCGADINWYLTKAGELNISGTGDMSNYAYDSYYSRPNTPWTTNRSAVTSVVLSEGITSIGNYALSYLSKVTQITIPSTVTVIGDSAFSNSGLTEVVIPDSVTSVGTYAFSNSSKLESVTIGIGVETLGSNAFYNCGALTTINYAGTYEQWNALTLNTGNNNIVLLKNGWLGYGTCGADINWYLTKAGELNISGTGDMSNYAYDSYYSRPNTPWTTNRSAVTSVVLSEGITSIGNYALSYLSKVTQITIPSTVTAIGDSAFSSSGLTEVVIPDSVTSVGTYAFSGNTKLESVTIGIGVETLGSNAFYNCGALTTINYAGTYEQWNALTLNTGNNNIVLLKNKWIGYGTCGADINWYLTKAGELNISGTGDMSNYAYDSYYSRPNTPWTTNRSSVTSVVLSEGITSIGEYALSYLTNVTKVELPESITTIGYRAFTASGLKEIVIPDSVTYVGSYAFSSNANLETVTLGTGLTKLGSDAFYYCNALKTVNYAGTEEALLALAIDNPILIRVKYGWTDYGSCGENLTWHLTTNNTLVISGSGSMESFLDTSSTTSSTAPWWKYRSSITGLVLPEGLTNIGYYAFYGLSKLASVTVPGTVTHINSRAFYNCTSLNSLSLPASVRHIDAGAFYGCPLQYITYGGTQEQFMHAYLGQDNAALIRGITGWSSAGSCGTWANWGLDSEGTLHIFGRFDIKDYTSNNSPWYNLKSQINKVVIYDGITGIGKYAFYFCEGVQQVILPESLESIGEYAFYGCSKLSHIDLPNSNLSLYERCFGGTGLQEVVLPAKAWVRSEAFLNCPNLTTVVVGSEVTLVGERAFAGCTALRRVYFLGSMPSIGKNAFPNSTVPIYYPAFDTSYENADSSFNWIPHAPTTSEAPHSSAYSPTITYAALTTNGTATLRWTEVNPDTQYKVYMRTESSGWSLYRSTYTTELTGIALTAGHRYEFRVECVCGICGGSTGIGAVDIASVLYTEKPEVFQIRMEPEGLHVFWDSVEAGEEYAVFVKDGTVWKQVGQTAETDFLLDAPKVGETISVTVRSARADGSYASSYNTTGWSFTRLAQPKLTSAECGRQGVEITWQLVPGAERYTILRRIGDGDWVPYTYAYGLSYTDTRVTSGQEYTYSVVCMDANNAYASSYDPDGMTVRYYAAASLDTPESLADGVHLNWNAVDGVTRYSVMMREGSGTWTTLAETTETSYVVPADKFVSGTTYSFNVMSMSPDGMSSVGYCDPNGQTICYLECPVITSAVNAYGGVKLQWKAVPGADYYVIYYYGTSDYYGSYTGWQRITTTTDTAYIAPANSNEVRYAVRAERNDDSGSSFYGMERYHHYIAAPEISAATSSSVGITVSWNAPQDSEMYAVYCKTGSSGWVKKVETTATSASIRGLTVGTDYAFTVRCIDPVTRAAVSGYDPQGVTARYLTAPVLVGASNAVGGALVCWKAVPGAVRYVVFAKEYYGSWVKKGTTTQTSMTVSGLTSGKTYFFTVRCVSADGSTNLSPYDTTGVSLDYIEAARITATKCVLSGMEITWKTIPNIYKYNVYMKNSAGKWSLKETVYNRSSCVITGLTSGKEYTFTVRGVDWAGSCLGSYDSVGTTAKYVQPIPVLTSTANVYNGVTVKWKAVPGATNYAVYCKTGTGGWAKKGTTWDTEYTVTGLTSGKEYVFTVRCVSDDGATNLSGYDANGLKRTYIAPPTLTSASSVAGGVEVRWKTVPGAVRYTVYAKAPEGKWAKKGETDKTSFTVTGLTSGNSYYFTARCVTADGTTFVSAYDSTGISCKYTAAPVLTSVVNSYGGVTVSWKAVPGAYRYRVFRKTDGGSWVTAGDSFDTSYLVTGLENGKTYSFTVRCYSPTLQAASGYDTTGKQLVYRAAPVIQSAANGANGVTLRWNAVAGIPRYKIYYKNYAEGAWIYSGSTTGTSFTVTGLYSGEYYFAVRGVTSDGKTALTGYDTEGYCFEYFAPPTITSVKNTMEGVSVKWNAETDAACYRVFYRTAGSSWTAGATVSNAYCTVKGLKSGTQYWFTVRSLDSSGNYLSAYLTPGTSIVYTPTTLPTPSLNSVSNSSSGVYVSWSSVSDAEGYTVYYRTASGSWRVGATTSSTGATVTGLTSGTNYWFTVACTTLDGSKMSKYDTAGLPIKYLEAPEVYSVYESYGTTYVSWNSVPGASNYELMYRTAGGSWTSMQTTTNTSKGVTGVTPGVTYFFTVKAYASDGTASSYNTAGYSYSKKFSLSSQSVSGLASFVRNNGSYSGGRYSYQYTDVNGSWSGSTNTNIIVMMYDTSDSTLTFQITKAQLYGPEYQLTFALDVYDQTCPYSKALAGYRNGSYDFDGFTNEFVASSYYRYKSLSFKLSHNNGTSSPGEYTVNSYLNDSVSYCMEYLSDYLYNNFNLSLSSIGFSSY